VAVAPKPETPSPKPEAPRPVVAVLPKPETPAPKPEVDLIAYYDEVKAVNELTDKYDYESVSARANLLKDKYAELIQTKLSNIERIVKLRKRCIERVNSGAVKVSMGDVSKRYAFAGDIKSVDEQTITATIKQKWSDLSKEEIANFYRKAADSNNADDLIGIAAFLIEGSVTGEDLDSGLNMLGKAKGLGADVSAYLKYIETLKQAAKEFAQAEAKGKAVEGEGRKAEGEKERRSEGATGREGERAKETAAGEQGGGGAEEKKTESAESAKSAEKSYDDVYVTTAATGDKIPHPLSKKTYPIRYMGRTIKVPEGMVYVPPGQFTMGEGDSEHKVYLDAFFIGKYEVTNAEWKAFVDATEFPPPRHWKEGKIPEGKENHPVLYVSWQDIQQYCEWVTKETGRETKLPTEAQWEKAARGPKAYIYPWGNQWNPTSCNWQGTWASKYGLKVNPNEGVASDQWTAFAKSEKFKVVAEHGGMTLPVGSFPKGRSFYGSHDMAGNAYEWCEDWFMTNYFKLKDAKRNPEGPSEEEAEEKDISGKKSKARLLRGECWISSSGGCRAVNRDCAFPSNRSHRCGFRMAVSLAVR
jgi:formylglycine-generating enzyme required for sulfatase activity